MENNKNQLWEEVITYFLPQIYPQKDFTMFFSGVDNVEIDFEDFRQKAIQELHHKFTYKVESWAFTIEIQRAVPEGVYIVVKRSHTYFDCIFRNMTQLLTIIEILERT
jgi:hypothetical protein